MALQPSPPQAVGLILLTGALLSSCLHRTGSSSVGNSRDCAPIGREEIKQPARVKRLKSVEIPTELRDTVGRVVFDGIICADGRVDSASITVVEAPEPRYIPVAREMFLHAEFEPARNLTNARRAMKVRLPIVVRFIPKGYRPPPPYGPPI